MRLVAAVAAVALGCASPLLVPAPAMCDMALVDTTGWQSVQADLVTLRIPPSLVLDTTTEASLRFYHGGDRWFGPSLEVRYAPLSPFAHTLPPWQTPPAERACWPMASGWEAWAASDRLDGRYTMRTWIRQAGTSDRWTVVIASTATPDLQSSLATVLRTATPVQSR
jgi:hypothetical protein